MAVTALEFDQTGPAHESSANKDGGHEDDCIDTRTAMLGRGGPLDRSLHLRIIISSSLSANFSESGFVCIANRTSRTVDFLNIFNKPLTFGKLLLLLYSRASLHKLLFEIDLQKC